MPVYMVVEIKKKDKQKYNQFIAALTEIIEKYGGRFMVRGGSVIPLLRVTGHAGSELTGPAFSPDGSRLYFSSQRGPGVNGGSGITYEVTGPFFVAA